MEQLESRWPLHATNGAPPGDAWPACLRGRLAYHAAPLHYLPSIFESGALLAKSVLAQRGIAPRRSAQRRDRMLGLADYVHLAFEPVTPLVLDKLRRGYPHAVLGFDAAVVAAQPGAALLPANTKRWVSRRLLRPVTAPGEMAALVRGNVQYGRNPGLELLCRYAVELDALVSIAFANERELAMCEALTGRFCAAAPRLTLLPRAAVSEYAPLHPETISEYFAACMEEKPVLKPPALEFD